MVNDNSFDCRVHIQHAIWGSLKSCSLTTDVFWSSSDLCCRFGQSINKNKLVLMYCTTCNILNIFHNAAGSTRTLVAAAVGAVVFLGVTDVAAAGAVVCRRDRERFLLCQQPQDLRCSCPYRLTQKRGRCRRPSPSADCSGSPAISRWPGGPTPCGSASPCKCGADGTGGPTCGRPRLPPMTSGGERTQPRLPGGSSLSSLFMAW